MIHKPIQIQNLELSFSHKTCFENFNIQINYGNRIGIIGRNGSGKSTLLKMLHGTFNATEGDIQIPNNLVCGYVPQVITQFNDLSGGQRLNEAITKALSLTPNMLLLDEPTNHLDQRNRKSLLRMLQTYIGTLIVVSHDPELLRNCIDTLWHIDNGRIQVFSGNYVDYIQEMQNQRASIEQELSRLDRQKKHMHQALMQEQKRAASSKIKGEKSIEKRKWPTIVSKAKALRGEETSGRKRSAIEHKKQELMDQLANLKLPEIIVPKFSLNNADIGNHTIVSINNGAIAYDETKFILEDINLSLNSKSRIAISGDNGSGKSTLLKAILDDRSIIKRGNWHHPKPEDIGYLDQHYATLSPQKTVFESIAELMPRQSHTDIRMFLTDFLFRKNEEINAKIHSLSGGEKARLSLAQIAAFTPKLLILDEVTNNLDLETQNHVINVLGRYPGAMILISHDEEFLREIRVEEYYQIVEQRLEVKSI